MSNYVFNVCFNPTIHESNALHFLDHCLANLSNSFFSDRDEVRYVANKTALSGGLDPKEMGRFWKQHRELIRSLAIQASERRVFTANYTAFYRDDLTDVYAVLDKLAEEGPGLDTESSS